jgi:type I restriction enzyme, S subunit
MFRKEIVMNNETAALLEKHFDTAFAAPDGIKKLRELILTLAMQGKLVPQDPIDRPASELLKAIEAEKQRLVKEGEIKQFKPLPEITAEGVPYKLPSNWKWTRLGECMLKITDGTHHSPINTESGDFLYISAKNIKDDGVLLRNASYVTKEVHEEIFSRCNPEYGNILYIKDGATTGIVTINNLKEPFSMLSSVALLKQPKQIDNHYLLFTLKSPFFYNEMRLGMTGVAITRVTLKKLNDSIIPLPPIAEQHRIVAEIDRLMARCDELEKLRTDRNQKRTTVHTAAIDRLLKSQDDRDFSHAWSFITEHFSELYSVKENVIELRKVILQLAVMGKLVPQDPTDEPASELLKAIELEKQRLIKEEGLKTSANEHVEDSEKHFGEPNGWEYFRLGNLAKFIDYRGRTPKKVDSGIPLITAKNVRFGYINRDPYEYVTESEYEIWMTRGFPKVGDLLFTTEAPLGNIAIIDMQEKFALAQRVICLQLHEPKTAYFMKWLFMAQLFQNQLQDNATGMTATGIKSARLKEIPIPLPPIAEQHRIVAKIDRLMEFCDRLEESIEATKVKQTDLLNAVMARV